MLKDQGVEYRYRDYKAEPLSKAELTRVFALLKMKPGELLRRNDKAFKQLGLSGDESYKKLIAHMAEHPTLLQRPIGIVGKRAAVGRPPEALLALL